MQRLEVVMDKSRIDAPRVQVSQVAFHCRRERLLQSHDRGRLRRRALRGIGDALLQRAGVVVLRLQTVGRRSAEQFNGLAGLGTGSPAVEPEQSVRSHRTSAAQPQRENRAAHEP